MVKIAKLLGKDTDAQRYSEAAETMKRLLNERCFDKEKNIYGTGIQVDLAFPMLADIPPADVLPKVKQSLFAETEKNRGGHIACGLVGIPVVTEWAIRNHEPDFIYSMLKKRDYPGYLYMLDNGGSATWEHWNGDRSRLHNCYNGVGAWFYEAVAGIRPDETAPGYKRFFIDPQIPQGVTWAKATKETPYGTLAVDWKLSDGELHIRVTVPSGSEAVVVLPEGTTEYTFDRAIAPAEGNLITLKSGTTSGAYSYKN
jgi:alpha-L-rhamnosidase